MVQAKGAVERTSGGGEAEQYLGDVHLRAVIVPHGGAPRGVEVTRDSRGQLRLDALLRGEGLEYTCGSELVDGGNEYRSTVEGNN